jgi:hypothetical protein
MYPSTVGSRAYQCMFLVNYQLGAEVLPSVWPAECLDFYSRVDASKTSFRPWVERSSIEACPIFLG